METALFVANVIHTDLTIANSSVWQWWLAVSPYDFKDGLVYIDKSETGGEFYESKLLWTLGNYSRFIRPGAKRISVEAETNNELKISAFKNKNGDIVFVCINRGDENTKIQLNLSGKAKIYETSSDKNLSLTGEFNLKDRIELPKQSVSTLLIIKN
jgi:O-glycosyl hydrolase